MSALQHAKVRHRKCVKCGVVKPLNDECYGRKARTKTGYRGVCLKCERKNK